MIGQLHAYYTLLNPIIMLICVHILLQVRQASCGTPTFLELDSEKHLSVSQTSLEVLSSDISANSDLDERELMWELIKDICYELDVDMVCYKILKNISALVQADRSVSQ